MEVRCENCGATFKAADERFPIDQKVRANCPKCKNKITIFRRSSDGEEEDAATERTAIPPLEPQNGGRGYGYDDYTDDKALEFYEEGVKLCLVLDSDQDRRDRIKAEIEDLGYRFVFSDSTRDATGKLRFHRFDLIVLADGFDGLTFDQSPILNFLNRLAMSNRRRIFLVLLGEEFKTMDSMMAFAKSANVVINPKDADRIGLILKRTITENDKFYKVFMDVLADTGKA